MMNWELMGEHTRPRQMHLLVSSMSALGRAITVGPSVVKSLREGGWDVTVSVTTAEDTPHKVAHASGAPFVAALGGDGYLSQVAQGVKDSESIFVPLPGGRGNDLCRALNIGSDPVERARRLARLGLRTGAHATRDADLVGCVREIDAMWVEQEGHEPRIIMGILSLGYEAHVNEIANSSSFRSGPLTYGLAALSGFASFTETPVKAIVDGVERDLSGWVASVSNSGMFGGGIRFVPSSDLTDGHMELVHVGSLPKRTVAKVVMEVLKRRSAEHPLIQAHRIQTVTFTEPVGAQAWADGDPVATVPFTLRVERGAIRVLT